MHVSLEKLIVEECRNLTMLALLKGSSQTLSQSLSLCFDLLASFPLCGSRFSAQIVLFFCLPDSRFEFTLFWAIFAF